jgi:hypothetical protein
MQSGIHVPTILRVDSGIKCFPQKQIITKSSKSILDFESRKGKILRNVG